MIIDLLKGEFDLLIRNYLEEDFPALCLIHDAARKQELSVANLDDAFLPLKIAAQREDLFSYQILVAEKAGSVRGFIAFTENEIAWLYVDPAYQRQGIASQLISAALEKMPAEKIYLEVLKGNDRAKRLYEHFGFGVVSEESGKMPGNESFDVTVYVMSKTM